MRLVPLGRCLERCTSSLLMMPESKNLGGQRSSPQVPASLRLMPMKTHFKLQRRTLTVQSALLLADALASPLVYLASGLAAFEGLIFVCVNMHANFRCKRVDEEVAAGSSTCAEALQPVPHAVDVRRALIAGYDIRNHGPAKQW